MGTFSDYVRAIEKLYWLTNFGSSLVILYIYFIQSCNTVNKVICRSFFRELNSKLQVDGNYNSQQMTNCATVDLTRQ